MDESDHAELVHGLPERTEARLAEIDAIDIRGQVGDAKAELLDRALHLLK